MILELDTSLLDKLNISINQLVFITLVLNDIKKINQDIRKLLSLVNEEEIQELISQGLVSITEHGGTKVIEKTDKLVKLVTEEKSFFDQFYDEFPVYVDRPDGTKGFLRGNINKCRDYYNKVVGRSKGMHEHIMDCLRFEVENKLRTGKLGYMKTMWKWLTQNEWETIEEQMKVEEQYTDSYGTSVF